MLSALSKISHIYFNKQDQICLTGDDFDRQRTKLNKVEQSQTKSISLVGGPNLIISLLFLPLLVV